MQILCMMIGIVILLNSIGLHTDDGPAELPGDELPFGKYLVYRIASRRLMQLMYTIQC